MKKQWVLLIGFKSTTDR